MNYIFGVIPLTSNFPFTLRFYLSRQAIGARLEELQATGPSPEELVAPVSDGEVRRSLRQADEEEDFLDEG